jgi:hypothetical protein
MSGFPLPRTNSGVCSLKAIGRQDLHRSYRYDITKSQASSRLTRNTIPAARDDRKK